MTKTTIRNAATVIMLRDKSSDPKILMGQRGASAAFMPNKFVFPGGALDDSDYLVSLASPLNDQCMTRLRTKAAPDLAEPLILAAIREVWEETGLLIGQPSDQAQEQIVPKNWQSFYANGVLPSGAGMRFVFRAVTPPGRPRRFDARFFMVDAEQIASDPDDFSNSSDELSHLEWIPISKARSYDLPFITEVVLAEIEADLNDSDHDTRVPYFFNEEGRSNFWRL